jgi:hypothetical protein
MKPVVVGLCLAFAPALAQASIDSGGAQGDTLPAPPAQQAAPAVRPGQDGAAAEPRRSRMAEPASKERPVIRFSAIYQVTEPDASTKDNCMKGTGTRLKRTAGGSGACAIGNGRAYVPER